MLLKFVISGVNYFSDKIGVNSFINCDKELMFVNWYDELSLIVFLIV